MFPGLSDRIERLESCLEEMIAKKVAQILDQLVNAEVSRIKKDVDSQMVSVKEPSRIKQRENRQ